MRFYNSRSGESISNALRAVNDAYRRQEGNQESIVRMAQLEEQQRLGRFQREMEAQRNRMALVAQSAQIKAQDRDYGLKKRELAIAEADQGLRERGFGLQERQVAVAEESNDLTRLNQALQGRQIDLQERGIEIQERESEAMLPGKVEGQDASIDATRAGADLTRANTVATLGNEARAISRHPIEIANMKQRFEIEKVDLELKKMRSELDKIQGAAQLLQTSQAVEQQAINVATQMGETMNALEEQRLSTVANTVVNRGWGELDLKEGVPVGVDNVRGPWKQVAETEGVHEDMIPKHYEQEFRTEAGLYLMDHPDASAKEAVYAHGREKVTQMAVRAGKAWATRKVNASSRNKSGLGRAVISYEAAIQSGDPEAIQAAESAILPFITFDSDGKILAMPEKRRDYKNLGTDMGHYLDVLIHPSLVNGIEKSLRTEQSIRQSQDGYDRAMADAEDAMIWRTGLYDLVKNPGAITPEALSNLSQGLLPE